jgi:Ca-activated chloride channel family protein
MFKPPRPVRISDARPAYVQSFVTTVFLPVVFVIFVSCVSFVRAQSQSFKSRIDIVQVTVSVTDAEGRLITGLTRDDFQIFEDGNEQEITQFTDARVPVSLGVLLDASDSMRGQPIIDARDALDRFVGELLLGEDEALVATFNHLPRLATPWTMPPSKTRNALASLKPSGGTAIYDALASTAKLFEQRNHVRAAMVVISDGADTASDHSLIQALEDIRRSDALVYAIAIDSADARESTRVNPEALRELTALTGGYTEVVRTAADLGPATARIADELNKQYTLGYSSSRPPDGSWRSIRVRVRDGGYFARARRGYYSVPPSAASPRR